MKSAMNERISIDPQVCHGQACIRGTRIPVHQIVGMLANGDTIDDLLAAYPSISRDDVLGCLEYAARLAEEQIGPITAVS
jgi:uncharacterized protein (DUF433 family)